MKRIILFGMPGAGKGTQARKIRERFNLLYIQTGEMIRKIVREKTEVGKKLVKIINEGKLVPDEIIFQMVEETLRKEPQATGYLLDGFPRNINQARKLSQIPVEEELVLYLRISEDTAVKRIMGRQSCQSCGSIFHTSKKPSRISNICDNCGNTLKPRDDDQRDTVMKRLRVFQDETAPVLDFYRKNGGINIIDAELDENNVFDQIMERMA